jgi:hypothetical protein
MSDRKLETSRLATADETPLLLAQQEIELQSSDWCSASP